MKSIILPVFLLLFACSTNSQAPHSSIKGIGNLIYTYTPNQRTEYLTESNSIKVDSIKINSTTVAIDCPLTEEEVIQHKWLTIGRTKRGLYLKTNDFDTNIEIPFVVYLTGDIDSDSICAINAGYNKY